MRHFSTTCAVHIEVDETRLDEMGVDIDKIGLDELGPTQNIQNRIKF